MRKFRKSVSFLLAVFLVAALLPVNAVFADGDPDTNEYTVQLHYNDNIWIKYLHKNGPGNPDWEQSVGDVPIGGALINGSQSISQIYCVDAVVPFHSYATSQKNAEAGGSGGPSANYVDTVPGYVAVSPENLPPALKAHWNEILWLVINGYSGNSGAGNASVATLNNRYYDLSDHIGDLGRSGGQTIPWDVALMATKVAIWEFTNPDVSYLETSFLEKSKGKPNSSDGIKHRQFAALVTRLTEDARAYAANPTSLYNTEMQLAIEEVSPAIAPTLQNGRFYYGPYKVTGNNVLGVNDLVFLDATGPDAGYVGFYMQDADGKFTSFDSAHSAIQKYGGEAGYTGPAMEKDKEFYIGILNGFDLDGVSITALARSTATVNNMPVVLVYQNESGEQIWDEVQAFVGLAHGVPATVYGQAALPLSSFMGRIQVSKAVNGIENREFFFKLTDSADVPVDLGQLLSSGLPRQNIVNEKAGTFKLTADSTVTFGALKLGDYKVTEIDSKGFTVLYTTGSSINPAIGGSGTGSVVPVSLHTNDETAIVEFTNTPVPYELSVVKLSDDSANTPLGNVSFELIWPSGYTETETTDPIDGSLKFNTPLPVPANENDIVTYTLREIGSPSNHFPLTEPVYVNVKASGIEISTNNADARHVSLYGGAVGSGAAEITVINEHFTPPAPPEPFTPPNPNHSIFIAKRSTAAGNPLPPLEGVTFTLEKDGVTRDGVTDAYGMLFFDLSDLVASGNFNGQYTLTEATDPALVPANHAPLTHPITFRVEDNQFISISVYVNDEDRASVTWLDFNDDAHDYFAFRIIDTYTPPLPPTPPSTNNGPPPPVPAEPTEPETPTEPTEPTNPTPDNPDLHSPSDSPTPTGDRNLPQTGGIVDTAPQLPLMPLMLLLLALCVVVTSLRLREDRKRGPERR